MLPPFIFLNKIPFSTQNCDKREKYYKNLHIPAIVVPTLTTGAVLVEWWWFFVVPNATVVCFPCCVSTILVKMWLSTTMPDEQVDSMMIQKWLFYFLTQGLHQYDCSKSQTDTKKCKILINIKLKYNDVNLTHGQNDK